LTNRGGRISLMKRIILLSILFFSLTCGIALAQPINQTDWNTFTITTYYPSPHGVYNRMEVKKALSVGNFTGAPSGLDSVLNLDAGQFFVGESMILKSQASSNPPDGIAGQLIYVNNTTNKERMLKFHNGTQWVNATGYSACITNQTCDACPNGQQCRPACAAPCTGSCCTYGCKSSANSGKLSDSPPYVCHCCSYNSGCSGSCVAGTHEVSRVQTSTQTVTCVSGPPSTCTATGGTIICAYD
jgi:hypothetical protein